jgi:hypothetical protein
MLCPSIPIDKNKKGGRNYDSSKLTDFKKICLISNDDTTKPNQQTDRIELRRGAILASTLLTIPGFVSQAPGPQPPVNPSIAEIILAEVPANKVSLTMMTYKPSSGSTGFPGILTVSHAYGINWYYVYLNCMPNWFQNNTYPIDFWCSGPNGNIKIEGPNQTAYTIYFEGQTNFNTTFPTGAQHFWIVSNTGSGYYSSSQNLPIIDTALTIPVQQVDYATTSGTAARPDRRAGAFIRDAFLFLEGDYKSRNINTVILDTPAFYV